MAVHDIQKPSNHTGSNKNQRSLNVKKHIVCFLSIYSGSAVATQEDPLTLITYCCISVVGRKKFLKIISVLGKKL